MSTKSRLQTQLARSRGFLEKVLADFKTPREWTHQVHPKANHALWVAGHLTAVDNFFISLVAPEKARDLPGYQEKFGMGSQPSSDASAYPAPEQVLEHFHERRKTLLGVLDGMSDEQLGEAMPPGSPDFFTDKASAFELAAWHEGMHAGQATIAGRSLGHSPVLGRPSQS